MFGPKRADSNPVTTVEWRAKSRPPRLIASRANDCVTKLASWFAPDAERNPATMEGLMPPEAMQRLDAEIQRVLRERYDNVIPLVPEPKHTAAEHVGRRRAAFRAPFRALTRERRAA